MANQKITDLTEKVTIAPDDLSEIVDSVTGTNKKVKRSTTLKDGSGTTIRDSNKVDLGGVLSVIATIRKNNNIAYQILKKASGDDGEFQQFIMSNLEFFLQYRATGVDLSVQIGMEKSGSGVQSGGGLYINVSPIDQSAQAGINFGKTGINIIGDIFGSGRASHAQYDTDYSNKIDALDPAVKDLVLPHIKWINDNNSKLSELSADPSDPAEGNSIMWQSNGTGSGDDGDIMMKITAGGTTKTTTIVDFSII